MEELNYFTLDNNISSRVAITSSFDTLQQRVDDVEATLIELAERLTIVANQLGVSAAEAGATISSAFQNIYSHAESRGATASGHCSHAEGAQTMAYGYHNCGGNTLIEQIEIDDMNIEKGWDWLDHDVD